MEEKTTINEGLGISTEWRDSADKKIEELVDNKGLVSDVIEKMILNIKVEEFGEEEYEITSYEKKLAYMGFMVLSEIYAREKAAERLDTLLGMLSSFSNFPKPNKDEDKE